MSINRLNSAVHKELSNISYPTIDLIWSKHASRQAKTKCVRQINSIKIECGTVVELEKDGNKITKLVVRINSDEFFDDVYVLIPRVYDFLVVTCWRNSVEDNHSTLNLSRLAS